MASLHVFWHRRDLRLHDNAGLYRALRSEQAVQPLFIFDTKILDKLDDPEDARVEFIHDEVSRMKKELEKLGSTIWVYHGDAVEVWKEIIEQHDITAVTANRDYEPYAKERDSAVAEILTENGISFDLYKDQVIFDGQEVVKKDGDPYSVFTPYSKTWKAKLLTRMEVGEEEDDSPSMIESYYCQSYPNDKYLDHLHQTSPADMPSLADLGFQASDVPIPDRYVSDDLIRNYHKTRNFPGREGTSRLSIHLRFGTISIRELVRRAIDLNDTFLKELIWRDFYAMILDHNPQVVDRAYRPKYDEVEWRNNEREFELWCQGKTGYPMVDAGMRQLNSIGWMHNRVRMVTASFLVKHLLIDWRWGEAYFAAKLIDYDLANNNGGWQWVAGSGNDAAPYFRMFNPSSQLKKYDKDLVYVKRWVPEYGTDEYPDPMVDHDEARERFMNAYRKALDRG